MNRSELQSAEITAAVKPLARARHMPDGAINRGEQRSLPDKPITAPTWDHAGSGGGVDDLSKEWVTGLARTHDDGPHDRWNQGKHDRAVLALLREQSAGPP